MCVAFKWLHPRFCVLHVPVMHTRRNIVRRLIFQLCPPIPFIWSSVLLYLWSLKGGCVSISDDLSCSLEHFAVFLSTIVYRTLEFGNVFNSSIHVHVLFIDDGVKESLIIFDRMKIVQKFGTERLMTKPVQINWTMSVRDPKVSWILVYCISCQTDLIITGNTMDLITCKNTDKTL